MTKLGIPVMSMLVYLLAGIVTSCTASVSPVVADTASPSVETTVTPTDAALIPITGSFFALSVADIDASAAWYSEKLGLKIVMQPSTTNQSTVIVLEGGGLIVELIQRDDSLSLSEVTPAIAERTMLQGIVKVGVVVEDLDKTIKILNERHVPIIIGPFPATADQRANLIIQDNEGNLIQFFGK